MSINRELIALSRVPSLLSYRQKKVPNSAIIWMFRVLLGLSKKSTNYIEGIYSYVKMITLGAMTNF